MLRSVSTTIFSIIIVLSLATIVAIQFIEAKALNLF